MDSGVGWRADAREATARLLGHWEWLLGSVVVPVLAGAIQSVATGKVVLSAALYFAGAVVVVAVVFWLLQFLAAIPRERADGIRNELTAAQSRVTELEGLEARVDERLSVLDSAVEEFERKEREAGEKARQGLVVESENEAIRLRQEIKLRAVLTSKILPEGCRVIEEIKRAGPDQQLGRIHLHDGWCNQVLEAARQLGGAPGLEGIIELQAGNTVDDNIASIESGMAQVREALAHPGWWAT